MASSELTLSHPHKTEVPMHCHLHFLSTRQQQGYDTVPNADTWATRKQKLHLCLHLVKQPVFIHKGYPEAALWAEQGLQVEDW